MASIGKIGIAIMTLVVLLMPMLWEGVLVVEAQQSCASAIRSLSPCISFSLRNSSTPSISCCSQLASMAEILPTCICDVNFVGAEVLGLFLNKKLIQALPRACKADAPNLSDCGGLGAQNGTGGGAFFGSEGIKLKTPMLLAIFLTLGSYLISLASVFGNII